MRHHADPDGRPSARTLITLTVTYVMAAGCHGALAVMFKVWWHGVLAVLLTLAAFGLLAYTARCARADHYPRVPLVPAPRQGDPRHDWDAALEDLVRHAP
jgi:hypothetical protein